MTLKIHVILEHYSGYFQWTGKTMKYTNAEFTETAHSTFKMPERIHKFRITRKIGTHVHKEVALKPLVWHNSPGSSTLSSPRVGIL